MQRGFISCTNRARHDGACFKYSQVNQHASHRACAAWLLAWYEGGAGRRRKAGHKVFEPSPAE
eukprot:2796033-Alexandrium_andersonii.AAC.1